MHMLKSGIETYYRGMHLYDLVFFQSVPKIRSQRVLLV